jgi:hypothetical protein
MPKPKVIHEGDGQEHLSQLLGDEEVQPIEFDGTESFQYFSIEGGE